MHRRFNKFKTYEAKICNALSTMQTIHYELNKVDNWCKHWRLMLNIEKSSWVCSGLTSFKINLTLSKNALPKLTSVNDLEVHYSRSLNFGEYISTNETKMQKSLSFILPNSF